jgi:hypothetical protein
VGDRTPIRMNIGSILVSARKISTLIRSTKDVHIYLIGVKWTFILTIIQLDRENPVRLEEYQFLNGSSANSSVWYQPQLGLKSLARLQRRRIASLLPAGGSGEANVPEATAWAYASVVSISSMPDCEAVLVRQLHL